MSTGDAARQKTPDADVDELHLRMQQLMASPGNVNGTAARVSGSGIKAIEDTIATDLEKFRPTTVDKMLEAFLRMVLINEEVFQGGQALLDHYLTAVLPVCNDPSVKDHLESYCIADSEAARYAPFITCFNAALRKLEAIDGEFLKALPSQDNRIIFCRNDPRPISANYEGNRTKVKPDVVITTLRGARVRCGKNADDRLDYFWVLSKAPMAPLETKASELSPFTWDHVLSSQEFKAWFKALNARPRPTYDSIKLQRPDIPPFEDVRAMVPPGKLTAPADQSYLQSQPAQSSGSKRKAEEDLDQERSTLAGQRRSSRDTRASQEAAHKMQEEEMKMVVAKVKAHLAQQTNQMSVRSDLPPMVQTGTYAANMLSRTSITSHAINMAIIDTMVWVWWCDREGAIQSAGIDFVEDLPRFLVLLLALQRFDLSDWGFVPELDSKVQEIHRGAKAKAALLYDVPRSAEVKISLHKNPLYHRYTLLGRGTLVLDIDRPEALLPAGDERGYVVKLSWPDSGRKSEFELIAHLLEACEGVSDIVDHLPRIVASRTHDDQSTRTIREILGIKSRERTARRRDETMQTIPIDAHRVLRSVVSEKLSPAEHLVGAEFLKVALDVALCHYLAWTKGNVHHRDISLANIMYKTNDQGEIVGVLNDWDLSTFADALHDGLERTGTIPFMAMELLLAEGVAGHIEHLYRHDLEALFWVLVWVCYPVTTFSSWETGTYAQCRVNKGDYLNSGTHAKILPAWRGLESLLLGLTIWFHGIQTDRAGKRRLAKFRAKGKNPYPTIEEQTPQEIWKEFCDTLRAAIPDLNEQESGPSVARVLENFLARADKY
ncbi:unnamed protein product [Peniophora sp. CBMAI 1063]|nr:unnamed protein product [Peniophora sp. CBMAI 1063]